MAITDKIKSRLNERQWEAVATVKGPLLVVAGPGSGKTRVIEYRVLYLLEQGVRPQEILLLTFTRKAAAQMLSRAAEHDGRAAHVEGGTFHSFAFKLVREFKELLGFRGELTVLDEGDVEEIFGKLAAQLGFIEKEKHFPKKQTVRAILSGSINKERTIREIVEESYEHLAEFIPAFEKIKDAYDAYKKELGYLDFDDLLVYAAELLKKEEVQEAMDRRYRYVMVDEYQDTNRLQGDIAYLLAARHKNIMVVGDDAQSIYRFRGAFHENIMQFPELFPNAKMILLEKNYRSTQAILDMGNAILESMPKKFKKTLLAAREVHGVRPQMMYFADGEEEARWLAVHIRAAAEKGARLSDQAILFRSSYISIPLQAELTKRGVPYEVYGGLKFYEMAHVRDILAHMKVAANPRDELSWSRCLRLLPGIGPRTAEAIWDFMRKGSVPPTVTPAVQKLLAAIQDTAQKDGVPGKALRTLLAYYTPIAKEKFDDWPSRLGDLEVLADVAASYRDIPAFLADVVIDPPERREKRREHALTLSTIHSAKGLEWDTVYLLGTMEGILPSKMAFDSDEEIEEEQRLLYVAVTRAKNNLVLLFHLEHSGGSISYNRLSRFLEDESVFASLEHVDRSGRGEVQKRAAYDDEGDGI